MLRFLENCFYGGDAATLRNISLASPFYLVWVTLTLAYDVPSLATCYSYRSQRPC